MTKITQGQILKAIDKLVREGRAVQTIVDGKPALKLIEKPQRAATPEEIAE